MPRNEIILKKKNEKTFKKKCKSKKKRSLRNKKKLIGGNDPVTIDDVDIKEDIQEKMILLKKFLDDTLIPKRDEIKEKYRLLIKTPQDENYNLNKQKVIKLILELYNDVTKVKNRAQTIYNSLNTIPNNDNLEKKEKVQEILNRSDQVLKELKAKISVTPSNHTVNNLIETITPITHTIIPI